MLAKMQGMTRILIFLGLVLGMTLPQTSRAQDAQALAAAMSEMQGGNWDAALAGARGEVARDIIE